MAALGAVLSILFLEGHYVYPISLTFALLGGIAIAIASKRTVSHEAFIGLLYAFGISAVFIILSHSSHGMETFQTLMASDILFTPLSEILETAAISAALGLVLYFLYPRTKGTVKDMLFFVSFAATVTSSVRLAGGPHCVCPPRGSGIYGGQTKKGETTYHRLDHRNYRQCHLDRGFIQP